MSVVRTDTRHTYTVDAPGGPFTVETYIDDGHEVVDSIAGPGGECGGQLRDDIEEYWLSHLDNCN